MRSWKTTVAGVVVILSALVRVITSGDIQTIDWALVANGLGLIFAKDHK